MDEELNEDEMNSSSATAASHRSCSSCQNTVSVIWHRQSKSNNDLWLCNFCQTKKRLSLAEAITPLHSEFGLNDAGNEINGGKASSLENKLKSFASNRKSKSVASKQHPNKTSRQNSSSAVVSKYTMSSRNKTRKHSRKPNHPEKAIFQTPAVSTSGVLWHNGILFSEGDVVSVVDDVDERSYYAKIRGLLKDQFCNKYAALTWLLPEPSAKIGEEFVMSNFILGPQDEKLYDLDCLQFVSHSSTKKSSAETSLKNNEVVVMLFEETLNGDLNPEKQFAAV